MASHCRSRCPSPRSTTVGALRWRRTQFIGGGAAGSRSAAFSRLERILGKLVDESGRAQRRGPSFFAQNCPEIELQEQHEFGPTLGLMNCTFQLCKRPYTPRCVHQRNYIRMPNSRLSVATTASNGLEDTTLRPSPRAGRAGCCLRSCPYCGTRRLSGLEQATPGPLTKNDAPTPTQQSNY